MWANERTWFTQIQDTAARYGVDPALVSAVIGQESGFNPQAYRAEPAIGDASRGLMQVLQRTAQALGYTGTPDGLFDPATSIDLGTHLLADNLARSGGNVAAAVSAYNGGWRPWLGFGAPAPTNMTVGGRAVQAGEYANQPYVDAVLRNLDYFHTALAAPGEPSGPVIEAGPGGGTLGFLGLTALFGALFRRWKGL